MKGSGGIRCPFCHAAADFAKPGMGRAAVRLCGKIAYYSHPGVKSWT